MSSEKRPVPRWIRSVFKIALAMALLLAVGNLLARNWPTAGGMIALALMQLEALRSTKVGP